MGVCTCGTSRVGGRRFGSTWAGVEKRDGRADSSEADEAGESSSPCVWAVKVLVDGTIVSGDSLGQVTFWDGKFGTMLAKFNTTGADVLALESSSDGAMIFASGIDPRIAVFRRTVDEGGDGSKAGGERIPVVGVSVFKTGARARCALAVLLRRASI